MSSMVVASRLSSLPSTGKLLLLAAGIGAILAATVPPSAYWGDSTEYLTTAFSLQVAHPNGYPLTALLGRVFLYLPVGNLAFRGHLLSAAAGCGLMALLVGWLWRMGSGWWSLLPAGMLLFARPTWFLFHLQEALTINLLFTLLVVVWLARYRQGGRIGDLAAAAFLVGLGSGNHFQILILLPAIWWMTVRKGGGGRLGRLGAVAAGLLVGGLVHLYLPLRAFPLLPSVYPPIEGVGSLLEYLARNYYLIPSRTRGFAEAADLVPVLFAGAFGDYTIPFLAAAAAGLVLLLRKSPEAFLLLIGTFGLAVASAAVNGPAGTTYKLDLYGAQAFLLLAPTIALAFVAGSEASRGRRVPRSLLILLACGTALFMAGRAFDRWNLAGYRIPDRFGRLQISPGPSNGLHFPAGDNPTNLAIYQGLIGAYDPSIAIIPIQGMTASFYYPRMAAWYPDRGLPQPDAPEKEALASPFLDERLSAAASYLGRLPSLFPGTVLSLPVEMDPSWFDFRPLPAGPGYLFPPERVGAGVVKARDEAWRRLEEDHVAARPREFQFRKEIDGTLAGIRQKQAFDLLRMGEIEESLGHYRRADSLFTTAEGRYFIAKALVLAGRFEEAIDTLGEGALPFPSSAVRAQAVAMTGEGMKAAQMIEALTAAERESPDGVLASALVARADGSIDKAVPMLEEALRRHPQDTSLLFAYANLSRESGLPEKEAEALESFLEQFPGWHGSRLRLGVVRLNLGQGAQAERAFAGLIERGKATAQVWNNLGTALAAQGKLEAAAGAFRSAIETDPAYTPATRNLERVRQQGVSP